MLAPGSIQHSNREHHALTMLGRDIQISARGPSRFSGRCQATPPVLQPAVLCRSIVINDYKSICCVRSQDFAAKQSRKLEESGSPWSAAQVYANICEQRGSRSTMQRKPTSTVGLCAPALGLKELDSSVG